ncbi:MAG TPA: hypothetical protein VGM37_20855 [Armatimonadota bacterium]|jgi:hypothetical protein
MRQNPSPPFRAGLPLVEQRPLTDVERAQFRAASVANAARAAAVLLAYLAIVAFAVFSANTAAISNRAAGLSLLLALIGLPVCVWLVLRWGMPAIDARRAQALGRLDVYAGHGRTLAYKTYDALSSRAQIRVISREPVRIEALPGSGAAWRVNGEPVRGRVVLEPATSAEEPLYSPVAGEWGYPETLPRVGCRTSDRAMSPSDAPRIKRTSRREMLWIGVYLCLAAFSVSIVCTGHRKDPPMDFTQLFADGLMAFVWLAFAAQHNAERKKMQRDVRNGRIAVAVWDRPDDADWPAPSSPPADYLPNSRERL